MNNVLKELITVAEPYDGEYAYCNYCEGNRLYSKPYAENKWFLAKAANGNYGILWS